MVMHVAMYNPSFYLCQFMFVSIYGSDIECQTKLCLFCIPVGNGESCHKPVHCYAESPNCTLFDHQTVIFVCECLNKDCITAWISNNDVIKTTTGPEYTTNVTRDIAGVMICKTDSNNFKWNVTVLPSSK